MSNKALWDSVCKTDPAHVKPITGKSYQGNSPKPYYIVERLTETFGPCGIGWGFTVLSERMERLSETDVLHIALVRLWYLLDGKRGEIEQMGQTKAVYERAKGGLMVDEDAPKKSTTDALVKCASYLGFAGDIFSGRWDDTDYVADLKREFSAKGKGDDADDDATSRAKWIADWLAAIDGAGTVGELRGMVAQAVEAARTVKDSDAEAQFLAGQATKIARAKKEAA